MDIFSRTGTRPILTGTDSEIHLDFFKPGTRDQNPQRSRFYFHPEVYAGLERIAVAMGRARMVPMDMHGLSAECADVAA